MTILATKFFIDKKKKFCFNLDEFWLKSALVHQLTLELL